jgi:cytochrome c556
MTRLASIFVIHSAACLAGCSVLPAAAPVSDGGFGQTVRRTMGQQVAQPQAGTAARGAEEFDAQSARSALAKHRDSFKTPPPTFTILGIGGSGGGGSQ